jgi:carbonic anhydrase/acetyltransferase-like protein (isoleucine patch superfamily)
MNQYVSPGATLGNNVTIGINAIIMDKAVIGDNCLIGNNVVIHEGTIVGESVRIDDNTVIGKKPLSSPRSIFKVPEGLAPARIGSYCQIGANVIIYAQCEIGERNLIADLATLRENVRIGDLNIIGRNVSIENFVNIGSRNKFETNCYITAYSEIEDYCFVAPCVATSNDNYMARDPEYTLSILLASSKEVHLSDMLYQSVLLNRIEFALFLAVLIDLLEGIAHVKVCHSIALPAHSLLDRQMLYACWNLVLKVCQVYLLLTDELLKDV